MRQYFMSKNRKSEKITVEAKTLATDTSTPNDKTGPLSRAEMDKIDAIDQKLALEEKAKAPDAAEIAKVQQRIDDAIDMKLEQTAVLAADNTATYINNFMSDVAKAVDADEKGQSYRATALRSLSLLGLETMTDDILTVSDITTYAQEVLCAALGVDWKTVADEDNLLATRGIYKEVLWVLTFSKIFGDYRLRLE